MLDELRDKFDGERLNKFVELAVKGTSADSSGISLAGTRRVAIVLTTKCNLECVWCHREEKSIIESGYLENEMDFDVYLSLLPKLRDFDLIHFGGLGEPLLYKKIYEAIHEAKKFVSTVKVTTNGTPLVNTVNKKIAQSGLDILEVSIDGFDGITNKKFRGVSEDEIIRKLESLSKESDIKLQVNVVVSENNIDGLMEAVDKLKNVENLAVIHTIPLFMTEHMESLNISRASLSRYKALLEKMESDLRANNLATITQPNSNNLEVDPVILLKKTRNICFTPYEDVMINVKGNLVPCGRLQHYDLGSVLDAGIEEVWQGEKFSKWRRSQLKGDYCADCVRECDMRSNSLIHTSRG